MDTRDKLDCDIRVEFLCGLRGSFLKGYTCMMEKISNKNVVYLRAISLSV